MCYKRQVPRQFQLPESLSHRNQFIFPQRIYVLEEQHAEMQKQVHGLKRKLRDPHIAFGTRVGEVSP